MTNANNDRLTRVQIIPCRSRTVVEKGIRDHSYCEVIGESFGEWLIFNTGWSSSVKTLLEPFVVSHYMLWLALFDIFLPLLVGCPVLKEYKRWIFVWWDEVQACRECLSYEIFSFTTRQAEHIVCRYGWSMPLLRLKDTGGILFLPWPQLSVAYQ